MNFSFSPTGSRRITWAATCAAVLALGGCGTLTGLIGGENQGVDYRSSKTGQTLEVPPDLSRLNNDGRYTAIGAGAVSASQFGGARAGAVAAVAPLAMGDVRFERQGSARYLVVARDANQVWAPLRDFWQENGFLLAVDDANLGVMETDWAENRAKLPQDFIRNTIGKVLDSVYSTGERDKFRTRIERVSADRTEIYVAHRGMIEQATAGATRLDASNVIWQPRASDPELEAEFLRRLLVRLGTTAEQAKAVVAAAPEVRPAARVSTANGQSVITLDESFDRAWRRVGSALDRTGFTVEDRDRTNGLYFVRYGTTDSKEEAGFFSRIFGSGDKTQAAQKFRVSVRPSGSSTAVTVLNASNQPDTSETAQRISKLLAEELK